MKVSIILVAAVATMVSGQCISDIPSCAQPAIEKAVSSSTTCGATDYKCQCTTDNQQKVTTAATADVIAACGQDVAINQVLPATTNFCAAINAGKTCSTGGSGSSSSSSSAAPSTTMSSSMGSSVYPTSQITTSPTATGNGTHPTTTSAPTSVVTAGAALAGSVGSFAMLVLGAFAAF